MGIEATQAVTTPIAAPAVPQEIAKLAEIKPQEVPAAPVAVTGDSVAQATPTAEQAKALDVKV